jgi:hypothetical protein
MKLDVNVKIFRRFLRLCVDIQGVVTKWVGIWSDFEVRIGNFCEISYNLNF